MTEITSEVKIADVASVADAKKSDSSKRILKSVALKPIASTESATRSFKLLSDDVAEVSYSFTHDSKDKPRYQVTTKLNFAGCSRADLLELASKPLVIRLQDERRKLSLLEAEKAELHTSVYVKNEIERERKSSDPHERSIRSLSTSLNVSYAEAEKLYAKLQK